MGDCPKEVFALPAGVLDPINDGAPAGTNLVILSRPDEQVKVRDTKGGFSGTS